MDDQRLHRLCSQGAAYEARRNAVNVAFRNASETVRLLRLLVRRLFWFTIR